MVERLRESVRIGLADGNEEVMSDLSLLAPCQVVPLARSGHPGMSAREVGERGFAPRLMRDSVVLETVSV